MRHPSLAVRGVIAFDCRKAGRGASNMMLDVVAGILDVLNALSMWRFLTCFAPAVALALFLFFSNPDKVAAMALSVVPLLMGAILGTWWERAAVRKRRGLAKRQTSSCPKRREPG
jgi:hypothetical protein